jgi:hypothetical protein
VRNVVLTGDEILGLTAGVLVSHQPAPGRVSFLEWLPESASTLGRKYANELDRHFRVRVMSHAWGAVQEPAISEHRDTLAWAEAQVAASRVDPAARFALIERHTTGRPDGRHETCRSNVQPCHSCVGRLSAVCIQTLDPVGGQCVVWQVSAALCPHWCRA